jgi:hypothetical protein
MMLGKGKECNIQVSPASFLKKCEPSKPPKVSFRLKKNQEMFYQLNA